MTDSFSCAGSSKRSEKGEALDPEYIFVYGTLKRGSKEPMHCHLARYSEFIGNATTCGRLYEIRTPKAVFPALVASSAPNDLVPGEVFRMRQSARVIQELDVYEECGPDFAEPTLYKRQVRTVTLAGKGAPRVIRAWTYVYNRPVNGLRRLYSGLFEANRN
jgi:gamma-glutamylcyclotransferase (GGCT)/AIG2-like uncharacterized protein YtfP